MNTLQAIIDFGKENRLAFALAFGWSIHIWHTVKGWDGLKYFFHTGSINPPENQAQPKVENK